MRVLFAGTPEVAVPALEALIASHHDVVAVLTRPAAPAGRGRAPRLSPVAQCAQDHGIAILSPASAREPELRDQLVALDIECAPIVAFGGLIPASLLQIPRHGWVNLHFSLLPAWRGAAPVQHSIWHGDLVTGACTFALEEGLDTGPVYGCIEEPISAADTAGDLLARLSIRGAHLLVETVNGIEQGTMAATPQARDGVSLAPKIEVDDARIDWRQPADAIDRQIRACTPHPGSWTLWGEDRIKIGPITLHGASESSEQLAPGVVEVTRNSIRVGTGTSPVTLSWVQAAGKKPMPAPDWVRGLRSHDISFH